MLLENSGIQNGTLTPCIIPYGPTAVLCSTLLERIFHLSGLLFRILIMMLVGPLFHIYVTPEMIVALCFLPPRMLIVTTNGGSSVLLNRINLQSKFGSYSMAPLG